MEGVKSSYFSSSSVSVRSVRSSCSLSDGISSSSIGNVSRKCSTGRCQVSGSSSSGQRGRLKVPLLLKSFTIENSEQI